MDNNLQKGLDEREIEVSIDERMEIHYLPKVISNSLNRNTDGLGEK
jgi:hypothetical protein